MVAAIFVLIYVPDFICLNLNSKPAHMILIIRLTVVRANLTRLTSPPNSTTGGSRIIFSVLFSYFLFIFYLPWCTLPDFPSVSSLASLPCLFCCDHNNNNWWMRSRRHAKRWFMMKHPPMRACVAQIFLIINNNIIIKTRRYS